MPKSLSLRSGLSSVLIWSVISAAFIGPGTVTTCAMAGSRFGLDLLWALTFSTIGTIVLQEAAARITIASGLSLGQVLTTMYGQRARWLTTVLFIAVALGCAAYQAGNLLGALAGLTLLTDWPPQLLTLLLGATCLVLLWRGSTQLIAQFLGLVVFLMGIAFAYVAISASPGAGAFAQSLVIPALPAGSLVLVIGLIGTTIVPYNLFLGSGISQPGLSPVDAIREMRLGISLAVLIGGGISMAILVSGTLVTGEFSFQNVAQTLSNRLGSWAGAFFAFGLFAAGFTSCLTAPLAAAVTARSLLGWSENSWAYKSVWLVVMGIGLTFGLLNVKPVPVIVLAQAANGLLLPLVTVFLLIAVNNRALLPAEYQNRFWQNAILVLIVGVTAFLGLRNLWLALGS
ncbi:Nramp family divalent metal transporter [Spirosoma sp. KUDC1026]|uniref:Nramp family divalent metal transporter n=1 Tax=Spirosoma sp. KUDC1026 TaxID=2745947 RepID=UPI00159BC2FF|nr:Nramp family divalent metal transporter [Spirosoma sp. KUDC1026]QKZ14207.1 Nramp family divalent metal transporter [Spirosoma sp. KUDC1026]